MDMRGRGERETVTSKDRSCLRMAVVTDFAHLATSCVPTLVAPVEALQLVAVLVQDVLQCPDELDRIERSVAIEKRP